MFWMFLINGLGVLIGFGLAFYLLLITQKGDCSEKPELLALVFFVRFLAQLGVKRIIVRSGCPEVPGSWPKKVAELCDCSLCYPAASWSQLLGPGSVQTHQFLAALSTEIWLNQRTIVRSFARIYQGFGVGVGLRSRCSVSERLPSPWRPGSF